MSSTQPSSSSSSVPSQLVRFGVFEADLSSGELRRNGTKVKIQDLPFRALRMLLSRPNAVLSREDLRQELWSQGVFVDFDRSITTAINRLREALGDSAENPIFIETVGRRGYRWIAPLTVDAIATPAPVQAIAAAVAAIPPRRGARGMWVYALPALAVAFVIWIGIPSHRPGRVIANGPKPTADSGGFSHKAANSEAEQFYLQGRFYWNKRTPEGLNQALDAFTQALVHDPGYAQAYVGLADCYNLLREFSVMPASEAYPRAFAAAKKAVELDDQSSEAHASLAFVSYYGLWDAATAEREFRRAIELNPYNATAHHWYATFLAAQGRLPESLAELERARAIDPSSRAILADQAVILAQAGRRDQALSELKQLVNSDPEFVSPHRYLKGIYLAMGDYPNYLVEAKKEAELMHNAQQVALVAAADKGYASGGAAGMFGALRTEQQKLYERGEFSPYFLAQTCARLGHKQEALQYLNIASERHDEQLTNLEGDAFFSNLHDEPAFRSLLARAGLPPVH